MKPGHSKDLVRTFLIDFQNRLTSALEILDGQAVFVEDCWRRDHLGQGKTRVMKDGACFEQAGVGFSEISGTKVPDTLLGHHPQLQGKSYWGAGVSLVVHPRSPMCPTAHLNYRYFESGDVWWFGGGCDLTPYYLFPEDGRHWHLTLKNAMDQYHPDYYRAFKYWCDEYFYNHHRAESRGIGGTFYDYQNNQPGPLVKQDHALKSVVGHHPAQDLQVPEATWQKMFAFQQSNADSFFDAYFPIAERRKNMTWTEQQRQFQLYRRGRYVEFNLLHDRGTLFGIQSGGRIESILMSLPPLVRWEYQHAVEPNTPEAELVERYLVKNYDWIA